MSPCYYSLLADVHKQQSIDSARTRIQNTLLQHFRFVHRERVLREAYIQNTAQRALDNNASPRRKAATQSAAEQDDIVVTSVSTIEDDIALHRQNNIRKARSNGVTRVRMPIVDEIPTYDAWVPVIQNFFVDDSDVEPYHPNFGESKRMKDLAKEVYELMLVDTNIGPFDEPSDRETEVDGRPLPPETAEEMAKFRGLDQLRTRAAQRHSILTVTRHHGRNHPVWKALSVAFGIVDIRRLRYICDLSERREAESQRLSARLQRSCAHAKSIEQKITTVRAEKSSELQDMDRPADRPLKYFCFACHEFACHMHEGENVVPVLPIPDHAAEARMIELGRGSRRPTPCSQSCFLLESWAQNPMDLEEGKPWTAEQVLIMRQAVTMFEKDPCALAVLIGGKTCREVHARMLAPEEALLMIKDAGPVSKLPRKPTMMSCSDSDEDEPLVRRRRRKRGIRRQGGKSVLAKKSTPRVPEFGKAQGKDVRKRFRPCDHAGGCFKRNSCTCALNDLSCEAQCGCNCGRYVEGSRGMVWDPPTEFEIRQGLATKCKLRSWGCKCKTGHCNTSRCECFSELRACNPDFCNNCECSLLPSQISVRRRRCRSADTITSRHKRTLVGRSSVHGYGLFAGEFFATGDLVGPYCGRVMDPDLADKSLRCSQAVKKTFAFDMMESLTVDGGRVGSKVKFINHSAEVDSINCGARIERVRGDGRIVLRAIKPVYPGHEFLFNYNILDDEGNDWMIHKHAECGDGDDGDGDTDEDTESVDSDEIDELAVVDQNVDSVATDRAVPNKLEDVKIEAMPE